MPRTTLVLLPGLLNTRRVFEHQIAALSDIADCIVPHYRSDHPESAAAEQVVAHLQANGIAHVTLRDGEVIVVNGDDVAVRPAAKA